MSLFSFKEGASCRTVSPGSSHWWWQLGQCAVSSGGNSTRRRYKLTPSPQRLDSSVATRSDCCNGHCRPGAPCFVTSGTPEVGRLRGDATLSGDIFGKIRSDTNFPAARLRRAAAVGAGGRTHWRCLHVPWEMRCTRGTQQVTLQPLTL